MVSTIFPNIWLFSMCSCAARISFRGNVRSTTGFSRPAKTCARTSYMGTMGELYEVLAHVFAGRLKTVVDRTCPLKDIRAADGHMEKHKIVGKVAPTLSEPRP